MVRPTKVACEACKGLGFVEAAVAAPDEWLKEAMHLAHSLESALMPDGWSNNDGDSWFESPDDAEISYGMPLGEEFELLASIYSYPVRYRIAKLEGDETFSEPMGDEMKPNIRAAFAALLAHLRNRPRCAGQCRGDGWRAIETAPKDVDCAFWVVPKTAEEAHVDTSGDPIVGKGEPRMYFGKYGRWSSLEKAVLWHVLPAAPGAALSTSPERHCRVQEVNLTDEQRAMLTSTAKEISGREQPDKAHVAAPCEPRSCQGAEVTTNVVHFPRGNAAVQELSDALRELVYSFTSRISVAEAVGALEVFKHDLIEEQKE